MQISYSSMKKIHRNGSRYCPNCGTKLIKGGTGRKKHKRGYCKFCKRTFDLGKQKRLNNQKNKALKRLFDYVLSQKPKAEFDISYFKLTKIINSVIDLDFSIPNDPGPYKVVYLDGIRFKDFCVLIARNESNVIGYDFFESEKSETWIRFISRFLSPQYVVCDGQKGLLKALKTVGPCTKVQRCIFHVGMNIRQKLTLNPETAAGIELLELGKFLLNVRTKEEKEKGLNNYKEGSCKYNSFLLERTVNILTGEVSGKHERIKSAVFNIDKLILNNSLFRFLEVDFVSPFNNLLEGGINSPLRNLIGSHRGATIKLRKVIVRCYLLKRSKHGKVVTNMLYKKKK